MESRYVLFREAGRPLEIHSSSLAAPCGEEILVRVEGCTLCRSDLHTAQGRRTEPAPLVLGHEIVGRIQAFGPEAEERDFRGQPARPGDRITWAIGAGCGCCRLCRSDLPQKCERLFKYGHRRHEEGKTASGGLSEHVALMPGTAWYLVPPGISLEAALPVSCATATVAAMLRAAERVTGETVLVLGAGVLGLTACAMARAMGAEQVVACDPDSRARERALLFGAGRACHPDELDNALAALGRPPDVILELAGTADSTTVALARAAVGGRVVLAGTVTPGQEVTLDPEQLVRRLLTVRGVHNYHPRDLGVALDFLAGPGREHPFDRLVAASYPLGEVEAAFRHAGECGGLRVAVRPG